MRKLAAIISFVLLPLLANSDTPPPGTVKAKITDGTNIAAVKPATTAPTSTDPSLVVAISPNSPISVTSVPPVNAVVTGNITSACASGSGCAPSSYVKITTNGASTLGFETHGTWSAVLTQDISYDPACTASPSSVLWFQTASVDTDANESTYLTSWGSSKNNDPWAMNVAGAQCARVRASAYTSGTVNVTLNSGVGTSTIWSVSTGNAPSGSADFGNPVKIGGIYNSTPPTLSDGQRGDVQLDSLSRVVIRALSSGTDSVSAAQSGTWTTGRTWTLLNTTDSVNVGNFPGTFAVTQSTSPWVVSGTVTANAGTGTMTVGQATGANLHANIDNFPATQAVTQSGTWNVGLNTGANTIGKVDQGAGGASAWKIDGSAVTQPISGTVTANIGTTNGLALDATVSGLQVSQGSTTSGQKGSLVQGAVTTAAPTYTTAQTSPISLTTAGALRTDSSGTTQPISGTVTANAGTNLNTSALSTSANQTNGTQKGQIVDGSNVTVGPVQTISGTNYLPVVQASSATPGAAVPARNTVIAGSDGTNAQTISVDTTGKLNLNNISGTVSLPTGASTSANQTNGNQKTQIVDGSGNVVGDGYGTSANSFRTASQIGNTTGAADFNTGTVSAQTLRVSPATDVTQKVQNNTLTGTGTSSALNATPIPATDSSNYQCLKFQVTGTSTQTLTVQGSGDNSTWIALNQLKDLNPVASANQSTIVNTGGESVFYMPINTQFVRLISTAYTSGTMTVPYIFTSLPCSPDLGLRQVSSSGSFTTTLTSGTLTSQAVTSDVASAARTVTFTSATLNASQGSMSASVAVLVTAVSGTAPTMDCVQQQSNDTGTTWYDTYHFERITATGVYNSEPMRWTGSRFRYVCTIAGTTPSFTFSISRVDLQDNAATIRRFFDRTLAPNSTNSTTASWYTEGCSTYQFYTDFSSCTIQPIMALDVSEDNTNFASSGLTLTPSANGFATSTASTLLSKFTRLRATTGGTGCTNTFVALRCRGS